MKPDTEAWINVELPAADWQRILFLLNIALRTIGARGTVITERPFDYTTLLTYARTFQLAVETCAAIKQPLAEHGLKMANWSSMNFIAGQAPADTTR